MVERTVKTFSPDGYYFTPDTARHQLLKLAHLHGEFRLSWFHQL